MLTTGVVRPVVSDAAAGIEVASPPSPEQEELDDEAEAARREAAATRVVQEEAELGGRCIRRMRAAGVRVGDSEVDVTDALGDLTPEVLQRVLGMIRQPH